MSPVTPIVRITPEPLDGDAVRRLVEAVAHPGAGGIVTFEGVTRDTFEGRRVRYLEYEAYPEMAERQLRAIADEIAQRWGTDAVALVHRVGRVEVGARSVVIVVACPHRAEAFEACRYAIDTLKATVPIWKKEVTEDGAAWVENAR